MLCYMPACVCVCVRVCACVHDFECVRYTVIRIIIVKL